MPYTLLQAGGTLKSINTSGALSSALALPTGVQLAINRVPRFAKFKQFVVVVNTPTRPISVDEFGTVRVLTPSAPAQAVALSVGASGTLSGTYLALQTYLLKDTLGNIISESDYGPAMTTAVAVAAHALHADFPLSPDAVSATRLYRTATLGGTYFPWIDIAGNTITSEEDNIADSALGLVAAPARGSAPDLTLVCEWGGRLFGVDRSDVDDLRWTEAGTMYGWSALNTLPIPHVGSDAAGIMALVPRRAALGVPRRDVFTQVTGTDRTNFAPTVVNGGEQVGVLSNESVVVYNDIAYFLWRDGVYKWDGNGISCVTNGSVRSWFTSDQYFNRSMFWRAVAQLDPIALKYRLFLASLGSANLDRWIEMDLLTGAWWGPHKTDAFTPSCALLVQGADQQPYFMIGSKEGFLSQDQDARNDWDAFPIDLSVKTTRMAAKEPDLEKYFGEVSVMTKKQDAGTLTVTLSAGDEDAETARATYAHDLTKSRERLGRVGVGTGAILTFENNELNRDVAIEGFEINPVNIVGRR